MQLDERLWDETDRLVALRSFAILDTGPEQVFDELANLAARVCDAPIALISFVDENRQWFKCAVGLDTRETPLSHSICIDAIQQDGTFVVPDTKKDRRFAKNPAVLGKPHVRFYAGAVLKTSEGLPLGTLCVLDTCPRPAGLTSVQSETIAILARSVERELELRRAAIESRQQNLLLDVALQNMGQGLCVFDREGRLLICNSRYAQMYGLPPDLVRPGTRLQDIIDHRYKNGTGPEMTRAEYLSRSHIAGAGGEIDVPVRTSDGRTIAIGHQPMAGGGWVSTHTDITDATQASDALQASEERLRLALNAGRMVAWEWDLSTGYIKRSDGALSMLGLGSGPVYDFLRNIHPEDEVAITEFWANLDEQSRSIEIRYLWPEGRLRWLGIRAQKPTHDKILGMTFDITERKEAELESWWLAHHDPLTGLANRTLFLENFSKVLRHAESNGSNVNILLLDLDEFKDVNDTLGHDAGDALLKEVARRLSAMLRDCDTLARIGGDEFGMLIVEPLNFDNCVRLAEHMVDELRRPFSYKNRWLSCRASIGVASLRDHDSSIPDLMKDADVALYRAKTEGRNRALGYRPEMREQAEKKVKLLEEVRQALADEQFVPFYQPKLCFTTGEVIGFEALARWLHPTRGVLTPGVFGAAFNDPEIADAIGEQMVRKVAHDLRRWLAGGTDCGAVAINLASAEFRNPGLADFIMTVWEGAGLSFKHLEIEVTETVFLGSGSGNVKSILRRFRDCGVRIALDDFGTGYASLAHLKEFKVDHIKIDQSFIRGLLHNPHDRAIVGAILALGRSFGVAVTAEGIETEDHAAQLRRLGCEFGQGYLYARPMPAAQVPSFLQHRRVERIEDSSALVQGEGSALAAKLETAGVATAVIDALVSQICVIDREGMIVAVNRAWRQFSADNGGHPAGSDVGTHYLQTCYNSSGPGADEAGDFAEGIRAVLEGRSDLFELEYPCHSPTEFRWFLGRVTPLGIEEGGAVVSHLNITERKAIESQLLKLAGTDALTELPNRRYFFDVSAREVERVRRFGAPTMIVMFDLDRFKAVNDAKGHAAGDKTLQVVARACSEELREIDILARLGGEEFAAILPATNLAGGLKVAEKLRRAIAGARIDLGSDSLHVTASFGVAEIWPDDASIEDALGRADKALYEAKAAGRNRVKSFAPIHFKTGKRRLAG